MSVLVLVLRGFYRGIKVESHHKNEIFANHGKFFMFVVARGKGEEKKRREEKREKKKKGKMRFQLLLSLKLQRHQGIPGPRSSTPGRNGHFEL